MASRRIDERGDISLWPADPTERAVAVACRRSSDPSSRTARRLAAWFLTGRRLRGAVAQVPLLSPELDDAVLHNLCGLVALACGASEERRSRGRDSLRAARLEAAKHHIDQHLAEPGLTPGSTAAALGISLRHLHLLFEPTGISFAQYVTQRRLLQCRAALSGPMGVARSGFPT
jgi:transcriptional regulator GlxA family with amidase domain